MKQTRLRYFKTKQPHYYNLVLNGIGSAIAMALVWLFVNSPEVYRFLIARYSTKTLIGLLIVLIGLGVSIFFLFRTKHYAQLKHDPRTMPLAGDMKVWDGRDGHEADGGGVDVAG